MTIPPLSSSEDESARNQPSDRCADALSVGLDTERAASLASDLRSPSIDQTGRWHTKDAVYATKPRALLDAAADALLAPSDPSTAWRGIESAPKDGTSILVFFSRTGLGVQQVSWTAPEWTDDRLWCVDDNKHGPYALRGYLDDDATHWMPLPGAPS